MKSSELLIGAFERVTELTADAVDGVSVEQLHERLDPEANSIAWLLWHLARVQDDHLAGVSGLPQVWTEQGWQERFGLGFPAGDIGYGHSSADVAAVRVESGALLADYQRAVHEQTVRYLGGVTDADLDRVVDEDWDPPVTLAVRLTSVLSDTLQHAGQAAFIGGILRRR